MKITTYTFLALATGSVAQYLSAPRAPLSSARSQFGTPVSQFPTATRAPVRQFSTAPARNFGPAFVQAPVLSGALPYFPRASPVWPYAAGIATAEKNLKKYQAKLQVSRPNAIFKQSLMFSNSPELYDVNRPDKFTQLLKFANFESFAGATIGRQQTADALQAMYQDQTVTENDLYAQQLSLQAANYKAGWKALAATGGPSFRLPGQPADFALGMHLTNLEKSRNAYYNEADAEKLGGLELAMNVGQLETLAQYSYTQSNAERAAVSLMGAFNMQLPGAYAKLDSAWAAWDAQPTLANDIKLEIAERTVEIFEAGQNGNYFQLENAQTPSSQNKFKWYLFENTMASGKNAINELKQELYELELEELRGNIVYYTYNP